MTPEEQKRAAAFAAAELVQDGMRVGLGSGSTAREFVRRLGQRVDSGLNITTVSSSRATAELARSVGLTVVDHDTALDLAVDGADAVARDSLAAIKGLGGALVRERLVAQASFEFVLIIDQSKLFDNLSDSQPDIPVPVEILPFGWKLTRDRLAGYGRPALRTNQDGSPYETDNGNMILDLYGCDYSALDGLAAEIKSISGVVDHGLFLRLATSAIVGTADGIFELDRSGR